MVARRSAKSLLQNAFRQLNMELLNGSLVYDFQKSSQLEGAGDLKVPLPADAREYLRVDHPRLLELRRRYAECDASVTTASVWQEGYVQNEEILYFRGDNAYVWQVRGLNMNIMAYTLATYYLASIDRLGLLDKLSEDGCFGVHTYDINGRQISRDLLDSILELYFLEKHIGLSSAPNRTILDIGAGYGRLAHRDPVGI